MQVLNSNCKTFILLVTIFCVIDIILSEEEDKKLVAFKDAGAAWPPAKIASVVSDEKHTDPVKPKKKHTKIAESLECGEDVKRFCADKVNSNNFVILDCLQDDDRTFNKLSPECHHFLWSYKMKLTKDNRFEEASAEACATEFAKFSDCNNLEQGQTIPCLLEHYKDISSPPCKIFLDKMASIIFSDYRFMKFFIKDCKTDINILKCGRLDEEKDEDNSPHKQGKTIECLNEHRGNLTKLCKRSLLKVAELQSNDFHRDRPLYYACKEDRETLCADVVAGEGAVYKCLYKHLGDDKLSDKCRQTLEERQKLIAEDVKADKTFYEACKEDIDDNGCSQPKMDGDNSAEEDLSRSSILLCLEEAHSRKKKVKAECLQEMFELRSELMQDYMISPELASACNSEIIKHCNGLKRGGRTLHCLMKEASIKKRGSSDEEEFSAQCTAEIKKLLRVANPAEDVHLDAPLYQACQDMVKKSCSKFRPGQGDVITCLMENLDHEDMNDECEEALLIIQYFAARDFRLDIHLFQQCEADAKRFCPTSRDPQEPDHGPLIFSCLHRHFRNPGAGKLSRPCSHEIKRVMKARSMRIKLLPDVESACLADLGRFCSANGEHKQVGGEMECLQNNMEELSDNCKAVVGNFTEEEMEDIDMDKILMRACTPMIKTFCGNLLDSHAIPNDVLDCLIEHKNDHNMDEKCAAGIEHHQIISLKDFKFNLKFRAACQESVAKYCNKRRTKYEVIACLSEHVTNDTLLDSKSRINERCKKQLKYELLQREENINLDPELKRNCASEIENFCADKLKGEGQILECLRSRKREDLSTACHRVVFQREKDDAVIGDYALLHVCKPMIKEYCDEKDDETDLFNCLKSHKDSDGFNSRCRTIIHQRMVERSQDFRLNPHLHKACRLDIAKFCHELYNDQNVPQDELEGHVIDCLKKKYSSKMKILTRDCEHEIQSRVKEAALDIDLNPTLMKACKSDIKEFCMDDSGGIMECLKKNFKNLKNTICRKELAYAISESRLDVNVDPILHAACQKDLLSSCRDIPEGLGRQMSCLLAYLDTDPTVLSRNCKEMLQRRKDLWEYAAKVAPAESFGEIYEQMSSSPARNYFFAILFTVVGIIFIFGLTCGRVTKRVRTQMKNK